MHRDKKLDMIDSQLNFYSLQVWWELGCAREDRSSYSIAYMGETRRLAFA